ncbi:MULTISPECIES: hypothetical protein [Pseudofrankia]|uniref:hypothetical protein n=1 Tax=Pseudofrankia TaxID=2994363 RepID=UPI000234BEC6|nr:MULTISPECIES: hypothetical protein [Pseudofrankia]
MPEAKPEVKIVSVGDVPWNEVKAQTHADGRRVSVWEKFLEWSGERMVIYARYDPGMIVERHGHLSDHFVFVVAGEVLIGDRPCPAGTHITLEHGAVFGPLVAGPEGATLYEIMTGDPRAVPADPTGFTELLTRQGVQPLPNPPVPWPDWLAPRTDSEAAPESASDRPG